MREWGCVVQLRVCVTRLPLCSFMRMLGPELAAESQPQLLQVTQLLCNDVLA